MTRPGTMNGRWRRLAILATAPAALALSPAAPRAGAPAAPASPAASGSPAEPAAAAPASTAVPAFRQAANVAVVTIRGEVDDVMQMSVERRVRAAREAGADALVIELDTPGGAGRPMLDICSLLKDRGETPANTVAWIHPEAYSAGTIIALACREIVVSPNAVFGDAAPISVAAGVLIQMSDAERAKLEAPVLNEVVDSARRAHYDENLVQAFIAVTRELWLLEHVADGRRVFADRSEFEAVMGDSPPADGPPASAPPSGPPRSVQPRITDLFAPAPASTAARDEAELAHMIAFEQQLPPTRAALTGAERGQWKLITQVDRADTLLTVRTPEALYYGLAVATVNTDEELRAFFGATSLHRYEQSWSEELVRFLVSVPVKIVLIAIFLIALFLELASPGVGAFGAAAVVSLAVLVGAPMLAGMAQWWEVALIVIGIGLIAIELLVTPGLGFAGVAGALCLLVGLVGTFVSAEITSPQGQDALWTGVGATLTGVFAAGITLWFIGRRLHSVPLLNQIVLRTELASAAEEEAGGRGGLMEAMGPARRTLAVGNLGLAHTDLRPSGRATFDGRLFDVVTAGEYIEKGRPVRVVTVGRFEIAVEEASA